MNHWLIKSDPDAWAWSDQLRDKTTSWTGVRNAQAANNMKQMAKGDLAFFYHSQSDKCILGIVEIVKTHHPDPTDKTGRFCTVEVKAKRTLPKPVTLAQIKATESLKNLPLIRQSRLSVMPVDEASWKTICKMAGWDQSEDDK